MQNKQNHVKNEVTQKVKPKLKTYSVQHSICRCIWYRYNSPFHAIHFQFFYNLKTKNSRIEQKQTNGINAYERKNRTDLVCLFSISFASFIWTQLIGKRWRKSSKRTLFEAVYLTEYSMKTWQIHIYIHSSCSNPEKLVGIYRAKIERNMKLMILK